MLDFKEKFYIFAGETKIIKSNFTNINENEKKLFSLATCTMRYGWSGTEIQEIKPRPS